MPDTPNASRVEERCPECDYLVTDHANGQRPDSTAAIMRGCHLTERQARECYTANELWKAEGWPAVVAAVRSDVLVQVQSYVTEMRLGIADGQYSPTPEMRQRAEGWNQAVDDLTQWLADFAEGK